LNNHATGNRSEVEARERSNREGEDGPTKERANDAEPRLGARSRDLAEGTSQRRCERRSFVSRDEDGAADSHDNEPAAALTTSSARGGQSRKSPEVKAPVLYASMSRGLPEETAQTPRKLAELNRGLTDKHVTAWHAASIQNELETKLCAITSEATTNPPEREMRRDIRTLEELHNESCAAAAPILPEKSRIRPRGGAHAQKLCIDHKTPRPPRSEHCGLCAQKPTSALAQTPGTGATSACALVPIKANALTP
jgi:hypothetical protein